MHVLISLLAQYLIIVSLLITIGIFCRLQRMAKRRFILEAMLGGVAAVLLAKLGSALFYDPRPFIVGHFTPYFSHGNDNGFPSDHTLLASFLGYLVLKYSRAWGVVLLVFALTIGFSRVQAGVHHASDILGSLAFAGLGLGIAYGLLRLTHRTLSDPR